VVTTAQVICEEFVMVSEQRSVKNLNYYYPQFSGGEAKVGEGGGAGSGVSIENGTKYNFFMDFSEFHPQQSKQYYPEKECYLHNGILYEVFN
jgi:hypothetical protein